MTNIEKGIARLRADFNSVRDGQTVVAAVALDGTYVLPDVGDRVWVYDPEGNRCLGEVIQLVDADSVRVNLDYGTWEDAPDAAEQPVIDLMEALRESVMEAQKRRAE